MRTTTFFAMRISVFAAACFCMSSAFANTVLWYRFEEHEPGYVMKSSDRVTNEVDNATLKGKPYSNYPSSSPTMPAFGAVPQGYEAVYDPVTGQMHSNKAALYLQPTSSSSQSRSNGPRIEVADDDALHLDVFTIEMFIARSSDNRPYGDTIVSKFIENGPSAASGTYADRYAYMIHRAAANTDNHWFAIHYKTTASDGKWASTTPGSSPLAGNILEQNGFWDHIALVSDVANQTVKLYVNYKLVMEKTPTAGAYMDYGTGQPIMLGSNGYGSFGGYIDEFRISDTILEPSQFLRLCSPNALPETTHYVDFSAATNLTTIVTNAMVSSHQKWFANSAPIVGNRVSVDLRHKLLDTRVYTVEDDFPGASVRPGLLSNCASENLSAVHIITNDAARSYSGVAVLNNVSLNNTSATIEFFFKANRTMFPTDHIDGDDSDYTKSAARAYLFTINPIYAYVLRNSHEVVFGLFNNTYGRSDTIGTSLRIDDGVWHHFAYVFDKDEGSEVFYLDGARVFGQQRDAYKTSHSFQDTTLYLGNMWAGSINRGYSMTDTIFDEIRITKKALRPCEFLTSVPKEEGNTLAWYSFENESLDNGVYTNAIGAGALGGTAAFYGKTPGKGKELWDSMETKIRDNATALAINGGKAVWPRNSLLEREDLTVEFFARQTAASANAGIVSAMRSDSGTNSTAIAATDAIWSIRVGSDGKTPEVYVNNGSAKTVAFPASSALGSAWRHYAVTFVPNGDDTTVKLYCNHELVVTQTITGKLQLPSATGGAIPMLGTTGAGSAAFNGAIDEVRVSLGEVAVGDMLYAPPSGGLVLMYR